MITAEKKEPGKDRRSMKAYMEKDCSCCSNCSGDECLKYGEDTDVAAKRCAEEAFKNYVKKQPGIATDIICK